MEARTPPDRDCVENNSLALPRTDTAASPIATINETPTNTPPTPPVPSKSNAATVEQLPSERTSNRQIPLKHYVPNPRPLHTDQWWHTEADWYMGSPRTSIKSRQILSYGTTDSQQSWKYVCKHTTKTSLVKWSEQQTPTHSTTLDKVTQEMTRRYLSPKVSILKGAKTFIFGMRLCAPDNHYNVWISQPPTRDLLRELKLEITVSNSQSSSGNVVTLGTFWWSIRSTRINTFTYCH
jgi:hypothetical protein